MKANHKCKQRVSQELSVLQDLITELIMSQTCRIHVGQICSGSGAMNIYSTLNKLERKEVHCACIETGH